MKTFEEGLVQAIGTLRLWLVVLSVAVIAMSAGGAFAIVSTRNSITANQAHTHTAATRATNAAVAAAEAKELAKAIQSSRRATALQNCQAQDARNRATIKALNQKQAQTTASTQAFLHLFHFRLSSRVLAQTQRASYTETVALINALDPYVANCRALAARETSG